MAEPTKPCPACGVSLEPDAPVCRVCASPVRRGLDIIPPVAPPSRWGPLPALVVIAAAGVAGLVVVFAGCG